MKRVLAFLLLIPSAAFAQEGALRGAGERGLPALVAAVQDSRLDLVKKLAAKGADVNAADKEGHTALFHAVSQGDEKIAAFLIAKGADLSRKYDERKQNVLFETVRGGSLPILEALLKKSPGLAKETDQNGETAVFEAVRAAQSSALRLLLKYGAPKDAKNKAGQKAIDLAKPGVDDELIKTWNKTTDAPKRK